MKTNLSYKALGEAIVEKSKIIAQVWQEAGPDRDFSKVKCLTEGDTTAKVAKLKAVTDELEDMHKDYEELTALAKSRDELDKKAGFRSNTSAKNDPAMAEKSLIRRFLESKAMEIKGTAVDLDIDLKTSFTTAAGWAPFVTRLPGYVASPQITPTALNFIPQYNTDQHSIKYMLESTYTATNAVEKAEGSAAGEVAMALTETTQTVEKIPAFIPVTDEQLEDQANVEEYLTQRLSLMVKNRIEYQCFNGTGVSPLLLGTLHATNLQTQAKGADPTPDAIFKAMTLVRTVGFAEPSVVFLNPADWQNVRLLRTADGLYIFGNPTDSGPDRIWGVPLCQSMNIVQGAAIVGDYANYAAIYWRKGLEMAISSGYSTYFVQGMQAVRCTARASMVHFRGTAFCSVTGL